MLTPGIYEKLIDITTAAEIAGMPEERTAVSPVDPEEAPAVLSGYVAEAVRKRLADIGGTDPERQVALVNQIIGLLEDRGTVVQEPAKQLTALLAEKDARLLTGTAKDVVRPETSLAMSSLFTGAVHEPAMFSELKKEIASSDRIDMLVSFIRFSGLRLILEELRDFTQRGGQLRVITTSYMGATELRAVDELAGLPNTELRVSYDTKRTRLHAKTYVFYRDTGFTTAYIGSSNLSNAAISSGMEWNVKVTAKDQPDILRKVMNTFDAYWNSDEFDDYGQGGHDRLSIALKAEQRRSGGPVYLFDIRPYPYQQEILDALQAEREVRGRFRNLVVAATGTGKTVISALDYRRFVRKHPDETNRLLFIAHREEILRQSLETFRGVLKDANFGTVWTGSVQPDLTDHVFITVQTLNARRLWEHLAPDHYAYIVVDETHHAAAESYDTALQSFQPQILLGLTATPERMDGQDICRYFDDRIAAEIRLPEAIERRLLCPFQYFGVSDTVELKDLRWVRGGYVRSELSNLYCMNREVALRRVDHILRQLEKYTADMDALKALGFCVTVEHAHFMAEQFNTAGVPSLALDGSSHGDVRESARRQLVSGAVHVIFTVDLYNEGIDIPEVNTVLFLRPTESLTIFLQQLGRGLRLAEGKDCLTVLDFIGAANRHYNFAQKFSALLSEEHAGIEQEIRHGFTGVPKGCYIYLEKKAREAVLETIRAGYGERRRIVAVLQEYAEENGHAPTLTAFLTWSGMDVRSIGKNGGFLRLCAEAGLRGPIDEPVYEAVSKALVRLSSVDSRRWIRFLLAYLPRCGSFDALSPEEQRMLSMLHATIWGTAITAENEAEVRTHLFELSSSPAAQEELTALLAYRYDRIDFVDAPAALPYVCPLDVHCTYTRDQLLCALGFAGFSSMREGVKYLAEWKTDILLITLNKSDKEYSPTTMYNDYAVNDRLFHWQSQSTTSEGSATGQRYIHHAQTGNHILLFVRECKKDAWGTEPYTFLGEAEYVRHDGSRPMNILWKLKNPIPAKYLRKVQQVMG